MKKNKKEKKKMKITTAQTIKASPPWDKYVNELRAMFERDDDIKIEYNEDDLVVSLLVQGQAKADALQKLLPCEKEFGNVTLNVRIVPDNKEENPAELFRLAFMGNPVVTEVIPVSGPFDAAYVLFKKEVVQYFDDNMGDIHGMTSTLFQEVAKDIFNQQDHVFYCTDVKESNCL